MISADFVRAAVKAPILVPAAHEEGESEQCGKWEDGRGAMPHRRLRPAGKVIRPAAVAEDRRGAMPHRQWAPPRRPDKQQEHQDAENEKRSPCTDCGEQHIGCDERTQYSSGNVYAIGAAGIERVAARILID